LSMFDKAVSFCGKALDYRNVAQTLNVLDYDTYFGVTEMLLAGNYVDTLVTFDSVLSRGFSGQTFMAGLNRHMRDLLMAKRPETLRLIEMTGTLLERYRTQAGACDVEFLFGAISCLTELDGKIRQSSNQRLFVELGLMKIAGLGQKKNDSLTSSGEYPLPTLTPRTAGGDSDGCGTTRAAAERVYSSGADSFRGRASDAGYAPAGCGATVQAAVRPEAGQTAVRPDAGQAAAHRRQDKRHRPQFSREQNKRYRAERRIPRRKEEWRIRRCRAGHQTRPRREERRTDGTGRNSASDGTGGAAVPAVQTAGGTTAETTPQPAPARPAVQTAPAPARRPLISGASPRNCSPRRAAIPTKSFRRRIADEAEAATVDPSARKLEHARSRILNLIKEKRPRFVPAFELMTFRDNTISVSVPTTELREEILRSKTGMLMRIAELAGIEGMIELEVIVNEEIRAVRPIKLEDRVRYITEKTRWWRSFARRWIWKWNNAPDLRRTPQNGFRRTAADGGACRPPARPAGRRTILIIKTKKQ
ncbi:MAG: hypothetical protein ACLRMJ_10015, partial [Alistipes finegoldii]